MMKLASIDRSGVARGIQNQPGGIVGNDGAGSASLEMTWGDRGRDRYNAAMEPRQVTADYFDSARLPIMEAFDRDRPTIIIDGENDVLGVFVPIRPRDQIDRDTALAMASVFFARKEQVRDR